MSKRLGVTNYLGIDSSNAMVAMARRNHPGYSFQQLGADELSSIERKFDHIIAINGVCSYIEDVDTFLEDVARLSKSRKGILLGFLNRRSLRRLIQLKTARTEALHCRGGPSCEEGNVQVLYYAGELLKMGQAAGFLNIEVSSYGLFGGLWQNSFATRLEKAVPILGRTFGHSIVFSIQS